MASSSASFDAHRFKSAFHQNLFEKYVAFKAVTLEIGFDLEEDQHPKIEEQIANRGWRRLTNLRTRISKLLIQEFYANAARIDEEMENAAAYPYKSYVRGVEIDFSVENIRQVLKLKDHTPRVETDFETRQTRYQKLDEVLQELCVPGAT
ncbi:hypothetical protein PIB30_092151 [Stylosanthes scabra]|uniref:Putative plant transposon protein domain-containing protein n=1 Tax=Stylosanthes scabra TaxID=79078 RepID=A0ABU6YV44_9FABA|nr:hypothetical protein [Stylosanthes scabra]